MPKYYEYWGTSFVHCSDYTALEKRLAEAEALLREIREDAPHFGMPTTRIDAFLAPDSASHRENEA